MFFPLLFVSVVSAWQIVKELCDSTEIAQLLAADNWCSDTVPRCEWQGVQCDGEGNLVSLELRDVPLNVPLPSKVAAPGIKCTQLTLSNCGLTGEFPVAISSAMLYKLDLSHNKITGNLPWDWLSGMYYVDLSYNKMGGAAQLSKFSMYPYLAHLDLAENAFYENLNTLSGKYAPHVAYFSIGGNKFTGRAPAFPSSAVYNISHNFFSDIENAQPSNDIFADVLYLNVCDTADNPFRPEPPKWLEKIYERCNYVYDPVNKIYFAEDFATTTSAQKSSIHHVESGAHLQIPL